MRGIELWKRTTQTFKELSRTISLLENEGILLFPFKEAESQSGEAARAWIPSEPEDYADTVPYSMESCSRFVPISICLSVFLSQIPSSFSLSHPLSLTPLSLSLSVRNNNKFNCICFGVLKGQG